MGDNWKLKIEKKKWEKLCMKSHKSLSIKADISRNIPNAEFTCILALENMISKV